MLVVYLALITLAEVLTTFSGLVGWGLAVHGVTLIALMLNISAAPRGYEHRPLLTLCLAPLIRLLSLSMPLLKFAFVYWYMIIGAPLLLAALLAAHLAGFTPNRIGLTFRHWPLQILIGLTGFGLGYLEYLILRPAPLAAAFTLEQAALPALILIVFTGFLEEFVFRSLMQTAIVESIGRIGVFYVAVLFAVLHLGYQSPLDVLFVLAVGLFFGIIVHRTRSILGVTIAHSLTNIGLFLIFPFIVK